MVNTADYLSLTKNNEDYMGDEKLESLRKPGIKFVPGKGRLQPDIMLIGEAPGGMENAKGQPFQGKAGKYLDQLLESININREDLYITNAVKYWPVEGQNPYKTRKPTDEEIHWSRHWLAKEIEIVRPKIVGLCGHSAIVAMFPGVTDVHSVHAQLMGGKYVPLYHPAMMGYKPLMSGKVKKGYKMLLEYLHQQGELV